MDDTYRRHDALHDPILDAVEDIRVTKIILKDLTDEHTAVWKKRAAITFIPGSLTRRPSKRDIAFLELKRRRIAELSNRLEYIKQEIGRKQRMLAEQEKVPEQLEHKRENLRRNAEEFSRRYQACLEKNEKFRK